MKNEYKLKPCPKCKKSKYKHYGQEVYLTEIRYPHFFKKFIVRCYDCGLSTKRTFTEKGAIKLWNRRNFDVD